jgi:integrase
MGFVRKANAHVHHPFFEHVLGPVHDLAVIILHTGMRPEEVFRMRTENLDFKSKTIFNPYGKTKAARRTIPMTEDALSLLKLRVKEATKVGTDGNKP